VNGSPAREADSVTTAIDWAETLRRIRADRERLDAWCSARGDVGRASFHSPARLCVVLYRWSHHCFARGWRLPARALWHLNLWLTGADLSPMSVLGEGLLVVHPVSVTIVGNAGRGLTVEGLGGMGGGMSLEDVGAGPGLPQLGDDVWLARGAMVLGPVRIGSGVRIGPGCTVVRDVEAGAQVLPYDVRVVRVQGRPGSSPAGAA
jgi:serine O-acetyltransferase